MHDFVEKHLNELFKLTLVQHEFYLTERKNSPRIDTLAFDVEKNCFVAIEYKKTETKDTATQLTEYVSAIDHEESKRKMMEAGSENGLSYSNSKPNWDNYYCIYIAFEVSEKLKMRTSALNERVRKYEVHTYDGILVLQRVGIDDRSEDDGLAKVKDASTTKTQDQTPADTIVPIRDLDPDTTEKYDPHTLLFPDGTSVKIGRWATVLRKVADWLDKNDRIKDKSQSRLLSTRKSSRVVNIRNNLYINVDFIAKDLLSKTKDFLKDINYQPDGFKLTLKPKSSGK